jgi:hypothetical protein
MREWNSLEYTDIERGKGKVGKLKKQNKKT